MEDDREFLDNEWDQIDARLASAEADIASVQKRLEALKADIQFWEIAFKVDLGKAAD
jgi:hypothetical protein